MSWDAEEAEREHRRDWLVEREPDPDRPTPGELPAEDDDDER